MAVDIIEMEEGSAGDARIYSGATLRCCCRHINNANAQVSCSLSL